MSLQTAPTLPPPKGTVGERIAQARKYSLLTQAQLVTEIESLPGKRATFSVRTLSDMETNKLSPTVEYLTSVARATRFPLTWFVIDLRDDAGPSGDGPASVEYAPWDSNPEPADSVIVPLTRRNPRPFALPGKIAA